jgi:hypothetical protein
LLFDDHAGHALHFGEAAGGKWRSWFLLAAALSGHSSPLPRTAVNTLWEMSNAGDLRLTEKNTGVGQKNERLFDSARCV